MNGPPNDKYVLGLGIRNVCDKLIFELNRAILDLKDEKGEKADKIKECKNILKNNFHQYLKQIIRTLKNKQKLTKINETYNNLDSFYKIIDEICITLTFLIFMSDVYIFPEYNFNNILDMIFDNCNNNLKSYLMDLLSSDFRLNKNLINSKDEILLLNNDFNFLESNTEEQENIKEINNQIITKIINQLHYKIDEFNKNIIIKEKDLNENNFKLYLDKYICIKIYNNFEIKFTLAQYPFKKDSYIILPTSSYPFPDHF